MKKPETGKLNLDLFKKDLRQLLKKHNVIIGVDLDGDTHCLDTTFVVVVKGTGDEQHTLCKFSPYLDEGDLR